MIDAFARLSANIAASLRFQSDSIRSADAPVVTRAEGAVLIAPTGGRVMGGLAYGSFSRSSSTSSSSGPGLALALPPGALTRPQPYAALAFYPSLRRPAAGERFSALTYDGGVLVPVGRSSGAFVRAGLTGRTFSSKTLSPTATTSLHVGFGFGF